MPLVKPPLPPRSSPSAGGQGKHQPRLAICPRKNFVTGETDWFQITTPQSFPGVDICVDCYNASFRDSPYARCISRGPRKSPNTATRCDFSDRWNRVAYLWLCSQGATDLSLLGSTASLLHTDGDGVCPNLNLEDPASDVMRPGKPVAKRTWYCLFDPDTGSPIEDLTVCSNCIARVNHIFPCLNRIFQPIANGRAVEATCDLFTARDYGPRGEGYISQIFATATETLQTRTRDTRALAAYIRKWAPIPICTQSQPVQAGAARYTFPTSIPNYAACVECYTNHILPLLESPSPPSILRELQLTTKESAYICDLYSPRLQQYFADACASQDIVTYKQRILTREAKMQELSLKLDQMQLQAQQLQRQAQAWSVQMRVEQSGENIRRMQEAVGSWYTRPFDSSRSTDSMNKSHQALREAQMVRENIALVRREWAEFWE